MFTAHRLPPARSHSRLPSRAASPALSTKSRKSVMSLRNGHRHSYVEQQLTDDESSNSEDYLDDFRSYRGNDRGSTRSLRSSRRSSKSSPQRSFDVDDDSETFTTRSQKGLPRDRRADTMTRAQASRTDRRPRTSRLRSESTQDSGSEMGTRALVQAKIQEKVARQSSMDESSSDFWKPKVVPQTNGNKPEKTTNPNEEAGALLKQRKTITAKTANDSTKDNENPNSEPGQTDDNGPVGPPPATPRYEWECEFCTFSNEADTKICAMCCKTPTKAPIRKGSSTVVAAIAAVEKPKTEIETSDKTKGKTKRLAKKITFWPGTKSK